MAVSTAISPTIPPVLAGKTVTAITAGEAHTCAVADGKAYCWGNNWIGQLGNNTATPSRVPVAVSTAGPLAGKTVTAITAGDLHSCAVADGKAYCWGYNGSGQLGNGSTGPSDGPVPVPVAVSTAGALAGKTVTGISAGFRYTCAVADGKAYCWGSGDMGQLGNGNYPDSPVPVAVRTDGVLNGKTVTAITTGRSHACAVADGKAYCWGSHTLGNNSTAFSKCRYRSACRGHWPGRRSPRSPPGLCIRRRRWPRRWRCRAADSGGREGREGEGDGVLGCAGR